MPAAFIYDPKHWIAKAVYRNAWLITIHHATSFFGANRQATHPSRKGGRKTLYRLYSLWTRDSSIASAARNGQNRLDLNQSSAVTTTYRNTVVPCLPLNFVIKLEYWYCCCHHTCNEKFTAQRQDTHFFDLQKRPPKENKKCDSFFPLDFVSQPDSEKKIEIASSVQHNLKD